MLSVFNNYKPISLEETGMAATGKRLESKFLITDVVLQKLCDPLNEFSLLTINNEHLFSYRNSYFDFNHRQCYYDHHRGKLPRFKMRHRHYLNTGMAFYEVKLKSNKGIGEKCRASAPLEPEALPLVQHAFEKLIQQPLAGFQQSIVTHYERCTLVSQDKLTRITIDTGLRFSYNGHNAEKKNLVICELKSVNRQAQNHYNKLFIRLGALPTSFSKYLLGCAYLLPDIKTNRVKPLQHRIDKLLTTNV